MSPRKKSSGIKSWAKDDRPREKLLMRGPSSLSNTELLAILINNGYRERSAIELSKEILARAQHNWNELGRMSVKDLMKVKGIGEAKAITIGAALEISRRRQAGSLANKPVIRTSRDAAVILQPMLADYRKELFCVLYLNRANKVIHFEVVSEGGISSTVVDSRIIFKKALEHEASSLLLCHNHPSGSLKPSPSDIDLTQRIKTAAQLIEVKILDHVIVSGEGYYSFADEGLL